MFQEFSMFVLRQTNGRHADQIGRRERQTQKTDG
jgi:hypothetical protein